jgi:DNA polymerase (family X)
MDNYYIADQFSMLAKLMDIHNENSFKAKSYSVAAFNIEKLPVQLTDVERSKLFTLKGIGESVGKKVIEILDNGHLHALEEYVSKTPEGILEMMHIKGLGPKKISTIWKEMEIETLGELLYACNENRLARFKGFGEKTQENVKQSINFFLKSQGSHLFAEIEHYAWQMHKLLKKKFEKHHMELAGSFRRQMEIIDSIEWITTAPITELEEFFAKNNFDTIDVGASTISLKGEEKILLSFTSIPSSLFYSKLFESSCSEEFSSEWKERFPATADNQYSSEEDIFKTASLNYIPPFLREKPTVLEKAGTETFKDIIQPTEIRGIIHSHSNWSDGSNTIEEMAKGCIERGLEYLVISDHSKSAFYANGLQEVRIIEQHKYVDELNKKFAPFRIFKSIECDILNDGSLDYSDDVLSSFDLVIASIHSNQKMTQEKAMQRLLTAIANPYTNILGHMTGRLLLSRPGYPVDHRAIIEACKEHNVVIELNANPRRLDMDWRFIDYALELGVLISIDPDAHEISEFDYTRFGVFQAQKAGVTAAQNLSSFGVSDFGKWLNEVRGKSR